MNRAARRQLAKTVAAEGAPPFHVHAESSGQAESVTIPADAARILLDICNLPGVSDHLQSSQAKLQVGYAQQALEVALAALQTIPVEAPNDDPGPADDPKL